MIEIMLARYKIKNLHRSTIIIEMAKNFKIFYTFYLPVILFIAACTFSNDLEQFINSALSTIIAYSIIVALTNLTIYVCKCYIIHNLILFRKFLLVIKDEDKKRYLSIIEELYDEERDYTYNLYDETMHNIIHIFENYETNSEIKFFVRYMLLTTDYMKIYNFLENYNTNLE